MRMKECRMEECRMEGYGKRVSPAAGADVGGGLFLVHVSSTGHRRPPGWLLDRLFYYTADNERNQGSRS